MSQRLSRSCYVCWSLQSAFNFVGSRQDTGLSSCVSVASVCHFLYHIAGVLHLVWRKSVSNVLSFFCVIEESTVLCGILSRIRCVCGILSRIKCIGKSGPVIPTLAAAAWTILSQMVKPIHGNHCLMAIKNVCSIPRPVSTLSELLTHKKAAMMGKEGCTSS